LFCPRCGSLLSIKKEGGKVYLFCRSCSYKVEREASQTKVKMVETVIKHEPLERTVVIEKKEYALPKVKVTCPKCGNKEAYWWLMQTRAADEPETRFYRCSKCGYTWREYA